MAPSTIQRAIRTLRCREVSQAAFATTHSNYKWRKCWSAQIRATIRPKIRANYWVIDAKDETLSDNIINILLDGADALRLQHNLSEDLLGLAKDDVVVGTFVKCVFEELAAIIAQTNSVAHAQVEQQKPRNFNELPALRLHLVGRGQVGKNFSKGSLREAAHARKRPQFLARAFVRLSPPCQIREVPAFIFREADAYSHRRSYDQLNDCTTKQVRRSLLLDSEPTPPQQHTCHFLRLPSELRNAIYEAAFNHAVDSKGEVSLLTEAPPSSALTKTCKQIRDETKTMHQHKYDQFWKMSKFSIDSSIFPTGWHVRPQLLRSPDHEWKNITMLRIALNTNHGLFNATLKKDFWLVKRVGGVHPTGISVGGPKWHQSDSNNAEDVVVYGYPRSPSDRGYARVYEEYELDIGLSATGDLVSELSEDLDAGYRVRIPLRGQICALLEKLSIWR